MQGYNLRDQNKIVWFFITSVILKVFAELIDIEIFITFLLEKDIFYGSFLITFKLTPLFLSIISYLIVGSTRCQKISKQTEPDESIQHEQKDGNQSLEKWEFLWQIPFIQLIRHFLLWKQLRKVIREKKQAGEKEAEMIIDSKIQTFRLIG